MKIYLVLRSDYDGFLLLAAFTDEREANRALAAYATVEGEQTRDGALAVHTVTLHASADVALGLG